MIGQMTVKGEDELTLSWTKIHTWRMQNIVRTYREECKNVILSIYIFWATFGSKRTLMMIQSLITHIHSEQVELKHHLLKIKKSDTKQIQFILEAGFFYKS